MKSLFVAGTATDVGKTALSAALVLALRRQGVDAGWFKPVGTGRIAPDVEVVRAATGLDDAVELMCPFLFGPPLSPHLAARLEGRAFLWDGVERAWRELLRRHDLLVVEGAGGLAVPLDEGGSLVVHIPLRLGLEAILVGRAGLGTINETLLSAQFAAAQGLTLKAVVLNGGRGELCEADNVLQIGRLTALETLGPVPHVDEGTTSGAFFDAVEAILFPSRLREWFGLGRRPSERSFQP